MKFYLFIYLFRNILRRILWQEVFFSSVVLLFSVNLVVLFSALRNKRNLYN
jgi:hypothetical protein